MKQLFFRSSMLVSLVISTSFIIFYGTQLSNSSILFWNFSSVFKFMLFVLVFLLSLRTSVISVWFLIKGWSAFHVADVGFSHSAILLMVFYIGTVLGFASCYWQFGQERFLELTLFGFDRWLAFVVGFLK